MLDLPTVALGDPIEFQGLRANTTYRVKAFAYADAAEAQLISKVDAGSSFDIQLTNDDRPNVVQLRLHLLDAHTPSVTTFAGNGIAQLYNPSCVAFDASGNLYWVDATTSRVRKLDMATGAVTTLAGGGTVGIYADGVGLNAAFNKPYGIAVDGAGNVYVADTSNNRIRKIAPDGTVSTLAGSGMAAYADGTGTAASFNQPNGLAIDAAGILYVADTYNHRIRMVDTATGAVTTLAGSGSPAWTDGTGTGASFNYPRGVAIDAGGTLYVADTLNHRIRVITSGAVVSTLAGSGTPGNADGVGTGATFNQPRGLAVDASGHVYVADTSNNRIRKITGSTVSTLAGSSGGFTDGIATVAKFTQPYGLAVDAAGDLYVADLGNHRLRTISSGNVVTFAGNGSNSWADGNRLPYLDGIGKAASFNSPAGLAFDAAGTLYVADTNNHRIRKVAPDGTVSTLAGSGMAAWADGTGTGASFNSPFGLAFDSAGNLFVADSSNNRIRKITSSGDVTTFAGSGSATFANGTGTGAAFNNPRGLAIDAADNLYVADTNNQRIRKITSAGVVTTLAGSGSGSFADGVGTGASFANPRGLAIDASGNLYVGDASNNRIRKITPDGIVTTLAGSGVGTFADGFGTAASFNQPMGVAVDAAGNVYVTDTTNHRIRKLQ
jgi:sugar lactone lactonase YvrE